MIFEFIPQRLLKKGIPLARYLVQELFISKVQNRNLPSTANTVDPLSMHDPKFFGPTVPAADWKHSERWGATLPASSLPLVLAEATRKWGDELELSEAYGDNTLHASWWSIGRQGHVPESLSMPGLRLESTDGKALTETVKQLYSKYDFMPFFTTLLADRGTTIDMVLARTICHEPSIALHAARAGWKQTEELKLKMFSHLLKRDKKKLLKLFDLGLPDWKLPEAFAINELLGRNGRYESPYMHAYPDLRYSEFRSQQHYRADEWSLLLELDKESRLDFDLTTVASQYLLFCDTYGCSWNRYLFVRKLVQDLPQVNIGSGRTFLESIFFGLETLHVNDIQAAHELLQPKMQVTEEDIIHIMLCNFTRKAFALEYGLAYVDGFSLERAVKQMLPDMLEQPYKGKALKQVAALFTARNQQSLIEKLVQEALETKGRWTMRKAIFAS